MSLRIAGAGVSGIVSAYLAGQHGSVRISEKLCEKEWKKSLKRSVVLKNEQLEKIKSMNPEMGNIIRNSSREIYKVKKVFPSGKVFEFYSDEPVFHVTALYDDSQKGLIGQLVEKGNICINFNEESTSKQTDVWATGNILSNIAAYGCFIQSDINEIVLYYDNMYTPLGYTCIFPERRNGVAMILAVCFDRIDFVRKNYRELLEALLKDRKLYPWSGKPVSGPFVVFSNYGYPLRLRLGKTLTVGEAGFYMDPLRGFGSYYAIMSAKAVVDRISGNPDTALEKELDGQIMKRYRTRNEMLHEISEKNMEEMLGKAHSKNYMSVSEGIMNSER